MAQYSRSSWRSARRPRRHQQPDPQPAQIPEPCARGRTVTPSGVLVERRRLRPRRPAVTAAVLLLLAAALLPRPAAALQVGRGGYPDNDVRAFGAKCDDSTDDRAAIQAAIDAISAQGGGTLQLPRDTNKKCLISGVGITIKDNVRIYGFGSGTLKAHASISDQIIDNGSGDKDGWVIDGVRFEENGLALGAVDISGKDWRFSNNVVTGAATSSQSEWSNVKLKCTYGTKSQCLIEGNTIAGSGTDATNDNCLELQGGADSFSGVGWQIALNDIHDCGQDGIVIAGANFGAYQLIGNNIDGISQVGVHADTAVLSAGGVIVGNTIGMKTGGSSCFEMRHGNIEVSGNHCGASDPTWSWVSIWSDSTTNAAGIKLSGNYFADGIWFDSRSTCTTSGIECESTADCGGNTCQTTKYGLFDHDTIINNVSARPSGDDFRIENLTNSTVSLNTILGSKGTTDSAGIYLQNQRSDISIGGNTIVGNQIGILDANSGGQASCLIWDDSGGGGFDDWAVNGNTCGRLGYPTNTGAPSNAMKAVNFPAPWAHMTFVGNVFDQPGTFFASEPSGSLYCGNQGKADTCGILGSNADHVGALVDDTGQSVTSTALATVAGLSTTVTAGTNYAVTGHFVLKNTSGANDWKVRVNCASCTINDSSIWYVCEDVTGGTNVSAQLTVNSTSSILVASGTRDYWCELFGDAKIGSPGGTFSFQIALDANSGGTMAVGEGSNWTVQTVR